MQFGQKKLDFVDLSEVSSILPCSCFHCWWRWHTCKQHSGNLNCFINCILKTPTLSIMLSKDWQCWCFISNFQVLGWEIEQLDDAVWREIWMTITMAGGTINVLSCYVKFCAMYCDVLQCIVMFVMILYSFVMFCNVLWYFVIFVIFCNLL